MRPTQPTPVTFGARVAVSSVGRAIADIASLAAPPSCAGCRQPGFPVCPDCAGALRGPPRVHAPDPVPSTWLPLRVVARYDGSTRQLLTGWKESGRRDVAVPLAGALAMSMRAVLETSGERRCGVVPIPASRAALRRRGEDAWTRVVRIAIGILLKEGHDLAYEPVLRLERQPQDQSALTAAERRANLDGALGCHRVPPRPLIVVDDIVTTGSTLSEAARALSVAGAEAIGAAAIAATSRERR